MNAPRVTGTEPQGISVDPYSDGAVLDIRSIITKLLKLIWIPILLGGIGFYLGVRDTMQFTPKYQASMIVIPNKSGVGGGSAASGPAGGAAGGVAASLTAFFGASQGASAGPFDKLRVALRSEELARRLDEKYGMVREVFANRWDEETQSWKQERQEDLGLRERIMRALHQGEPLQPGYEALAVFVDGTLQFEPVIVGTSAVTSSFWKIKVEDEDKERALQLLNRIYWTADDFLRDKERESVSKKLKYLESRIREAEVNDIRQSLIAAMVQEERTAHLLRGNLPYAADVVVEPAASDMKTRPILTKTVGVPLIVGVGIGLALALFIAIFRAENKSS